MTECRDLRDAKLAPVSHHCRRPLSKIVNPIRRAYLPAETQPVIFGVHGAVADHYKVPPSVLEPHATTLDYVVAATAG